MARRAVPHPRRLSVERLIFSKTAVDGGTIWLESLITKAADTGGMVVVTRQHHRPEDAAGEARRADEDRRTDAGLQQASFQRRASVPHLGGAGAGRPALLTAHRRCRSLSRCSTTPTATCRRRLPAAHRDGDCVGGACEPGCRGALRRRGICALLPDVGPERAADIAEKVRAASLTSASSTAPTCPGGASR